MTAAGSRVGSAGEGPVRRVNAVAPIRICDIGGWTDTWFAKFGTIFNIAVQPYVEVQVIDRGTSGEGAISIRLENYHQSYDLNPMEIEYGPHPLIDAAIESVGLPAGISLDVNIFSQAPPGASTGTSAAVAVALTAALSRIAGKRLTPYEVATLAHSVETQKLGLQCGVQDQLCSAYGGVNYIQIMGFPHASVSHIEIPEPVWWELENRLSLIYIGTPHTSSEIHKRVIADLGNDPEDDPRFWQLRKLADVAKASLYEGDFGGLGRAMDENTSVQRKLHAGLVCPQFEKAMEIARKHAVLGCKVNGAGGDGGSLTILGDGDSAAKRRMLDALAQEGLHPIPIHLSRTGVRVW